VKQLLQHPGGDTLVADVPAPTQAGSGRILVRTEASLISVGTERMIVEFARSSMLAKAKARPDLVKKVLQKARTEGVLTAIEATRARLERPMPLGYSAAGRVIAVGRGVEGIGPGGVRGTRPR
jgi:hypothetical protein